MSGGSSHQSDNIGSSRSKFRDRATVVQARRSALNKQSEAWQGRPHEIDVADCAVLARAVCACPPLVGFARSALLGGWQAVLAPALL